MAVFRVERNKGYTVMSNYHLRDRNLSLKSKGLLSQMLSLPEDWDYTLKGLSSINKESIDAIRTAVYGKVITVGKIREYFAELNGADFTEPITAGIFVSIAAWASYQRSEDKTPYWRTLKANGELNAKYPGGVEAQKEKLEAEGHTIIQRGRKNIKHYVKDYETVLFDLK